MKTRMLWLNVILLLALFLSGAGRSVAAPPVDDAAALFAVPVVTNTGETLSGFPLMFIENAKQFADEASFQVHRGNNTLFELSAVGKLYAEVEQSVVESLSAEVFWSQGPLGNAAVKNSEPDFISFERRHGQAHPCLLQGCPWSSEYVLVKLAPLLSPLGNALQGELALEVEGVQGLSRVFSESSTSQLGEALRSAERELHSKPDLTRWYRVQLDGTIEPEAVIAALQERADVEYAEPDYLAHAAFVPDDPKYPDQWGLFQIEAAAAWDVTQGSPAVTIAIVDTGVDLDHPDLEGKLWINPGEIPGNAGDDDGNGYVDDIHGWDWVNNDNNPQDDIGHGTHVAGVAAAATNNGVGIAGVCPNCRIMSLKVLDAGGSGTYSNIAAGIYYAADKAADIINLSLGGYADSQLLRDAVAYASQYSVIVAAAGNDNRQERFYPAAYDEYVVAVAATDNSDQKAAFSNYGNWVDISAPGSGIWSTMYNDTYAAWSGSSMAAPFVSGVAGLVRSQNPGWSAGAVRGQLLHTVDDIDALNPEHAGLLGAGRLNAYQAVTVAAELELSIVGYAVNGVPNGDLEPGEIATMAVAIQNTWGDAFGVTALLTTTDPFVTVVYEQAVYGDIAGYEILTNTTDTFGLFLDAGIPYNYSFPLSLTLVADNETYIVTMPLTVSVSAGIEYVSGIIDEDAEWTRDKTWVINGNILVNQGVTLTIQPGTNVFFANQYSLQVDGILSAKGLPDRRITVSADSPQWTYTNYLIRFTATSGDAVYADDGTFVGGSIIEYVELDKVGVHIDGASPLISHSVLRNVYSNQTSPIRVSGGGPRIIDNVFEDNYGNYAGAIDLQNTGSVLVSNCRFFGNSGTAGAINIDGGQSITLTYNVFRSNFTNHMGTVAQAPGALWVRRGEAYVAHNLIYENSANTAQSVVLSANSTFIANTVLQNQGPWRYWYGGDPPDDATGGVVVNCSDPLISDNNIFDNLNYQLYNYSTYDVEAVLNWWGCADPACIAEAIYDVQNDGFVGEVSYTPWLTRPSSLAPAFLWKFVPDPPSPVSTGQVVLNFDFSKPMSTTIQPTVTFGISPTHNTHIVTGDWISPTRWAGTYNVTYYTGDGLQRLRVAGAVGVNDEMDIPEDTHFTFEIATIGATSVNAQEGYGQVTLSWQPSDLETLAGYNLYRATQSGGSYTRLNDSALITTAYTDTAVSNGTTYYYLVKLLTTDLYEMDYGSETAATPNDYTPPTTPVVVDAGTCTPYNHQLYASWSASDPESGISYYQYSIGTWAGGTNVINWTSVGTSIEITRTGLSLIDGVSYYVNVKAQNGVGTWSAVGSSDGILVSSGCPAVDFTASPRSGDRPLTVQFTDQTIGSAVSRLWDFGDETTSTLENPQHTYETTGTFTVTLTVTGTVATNVRVRSSYIIVTEPPPGTDFTASPTSGIRPLTVVFTDTSTGLVDSWLWTFGDGMASTLQHPTHKYTAAGTYTVTLTVSGPGGSDEEVKTDYITVYEPVQAAFSADPIAGAYPLSIEFSNQSSGDYVTSQWAFGDGMTSTLQHPAHEYTAAGTYTVKLTVSGPGGSDEEVKTDYITVYEPVQAAFSADPVAGIRPLSVEFSNQSSGDYTTSQWAFGDGVTSTLASPTHTYAAAGTYTVTLTVSGPGGSDEKVKTDYITVYEPVQAAFSADPVAGAYPLSVEFSNQSSGDYTTSQWAFGDGATSTLRNPEHTYTLTGTFAVSLTVSGPGGSDTVVRTNLITVREEFQIYLPLVLRASGGGDSALAQPAALSSTRPHRHHTAH